MSKTISRKARHKDVSIFVVYHGNFFHTISMRSYLSAVDAREAARKKIAGMCRKLGIAKSYFTFEVLTLPLLSEKKRPKKSKSSGPY